MLRLSAKGVGDAGAPARQSSDEENIGWCKANGAVLVTNDRGKKDPLILDLLAQHHVGAIFVHEDLQSSPTHHFARAILHAEGKMDQLAASRHPIRHRLRIGGGLAKR